MQLATLCYVRHAGSTLMLLRNKKANDIHEGKWNGLGGKFEAGETPEECAIREVREECGLTATRLDLKGFLTFPRFKDGVDWYVFLFVITEFTGELHAVSAEGELRWIPDGDVPGLNLWEGDRYFLPYLERDGFVSGKFEYVNKELVSHSLTPYSPRRSAR